MADTREAAQAQIREAVELYLSELRRDGVPIPAPRSAAGMIGAAAAA